MVALGERSVAGRAARTSPSRRASRDVVSMAIITTFPKSTTTQIVARGAVPTPTRELLRRLACRWATAERCATSGR